ncbi:glucuronokinase 1-like isoform X2 [Dendronephthya gigantea]|uniref:glucuronokinase 1-like isoform X2 n=1 Tax=Dendronephthya gigantea TaxID=151771 RepID=UPI00106A1410|nr:glucuronokinase 1-like isoform X2 [Dendronephthya gigantea]
MICIILVAGHGTILENEIKNDKTGAFTHLQGVPKALLPGVGGKKILDFWWDAINVRQYFTAVYLVTNADKYKHYERWATAHDFPKENIVNDGSTTFQSRLGSVADFELVLRNKNIQDDVLVVAGDMLFQDQKFDICQVINYFKTKKGELAIYYEMDEGESTRSRGIIEVCPTTNKICKFLEKPEPHETKSRLASVVFYCLRKETLYTVDTFLQENPKSDQRVFGKYMEWLVMQTPVFGMKLPTGFQLIGQVGLSDYKRWVAYFAGIKNQAVKNSFVSRVYARIGLVGNPSDGFYGKTISMSISNFWAEVTITESEKLVLVPHPLNDPTEFGSLGDLHGISRKEGYFGGLRLLQATCKKFYQYCSEQGIALAKRNFTLKYDTNIPRQVGLAGSSAIVTATLRCLMEFFNLNDLDLEKPIQPRFILDVEKDELFIKAGLQDRVIQVYEGLVYMDFNKDLIDKQGYGNYVHLSVNPKPNLWLAYVTDPSDSGKFHSDVTQRWNQGDKDVVAAMKEFGDYTDQARDALEKKDVTRKIYGDSALGESNLRMVEIARQFGSAVKFPGSGGAVIGLCLDNQHKSELRKAFQAEGFVFCDIIPYPPPS